MLLRRALAEMGIPWREAGVMAGFSRQYLHRYLRGQTAIPAEIAARFAADPRIARWLDALGRNAADLAGPDDLPPTDGPTALRAGLRALGIRQNRIAARLGLDASELIQALLGKGRRAMRGPVRIWLAGPDRSAARVRRWLADRDIPVGAALAPWNGPLDEAPRRGTAAAGAMIPGNPDTLKTPHAESIMITFPTMRHFKLKRNPFAHEIGDVADIFLAQDHYYIKEMMLEAARHGGFCAVHGEVGSGKSTMRKLIYRELSDSDIHVIYPVILDKSRITAASLLEAVVMDLTDAPVRRTHEARTRQAIDLIRNRVENGQRQVLMVEEAHLLNIHAFKALKQIWEWEMAGQWRKLLGIVLIGQPELEGKLDKARHPQLREVIARVIPARIEGLGPEDAGRYLQHKFQRSGISPEAVMATDAPAAMYRRLASRNGNGKPSSGAYPLALNNICAMSMNRAAEIGEPVVSAELVNGL